jgi:hypothetical protein
VRKSGHPSIVQGISQDAPIAQTLLPVALKAGKDGQFSESWLQNLLHNNPELIPSGEIEPMFDRLVPICMELPTSSGYVDNLMMTPQGGLAIIEVKLWRNPQARREVVAQSLEYAKALSKMSFDDLERAIKTARKDHNCRIYDFVENDPDVLDEARFIDAVSSNLRRGRLLLLVIGDGIREEAADLIEHLQGALLHQFIFAFVEIRFWRSDDGQVLAVPTLPLKTQLIDRGFLRLDGGGVIHGLEKASNIDGRDAPGRSLTETDFVEQFTKGSSQLSAQFSQFKAAAIDRGFQLTYAKAMSLRGSTSDGGQIYFMTVYPDQGLDTSRTNWSAENFDALDIAEEFHIRIAALMKGSTLKRTPKRTGWYVVDQNGKMPSFAQLLEKPEQLLEVLVWYAEALSERCKT